MIVAAFIPARGGSKGIKRKNLRLLGGKTLLAWSIEAALAAASVTHVYVSTEDAEIAQEAGKYPVTVLPRPAALATDTAQNHDVLLDALANAAPQPEVTVLLQPTSPLRTGADIDACVGLLANARYGCAASVCACEHHPAKAMTLDGGALMPFTSWADAEARRQTLPPAYRQNGAVYAIRTPLFVQERRFLVPPVAAHIMPAERSVDIDDEHDLLYAENLLGKTQQ